ncbi:MAG: hypothetical protein MT337_07105, partial [Candidatus Nitrosopumilus limneticus]|nr:hypothetical protein [Candidatus Nitrosopumilus limneticus]
VIKNRIEIMNKITILGISLMFGLMIFAVAIPESYASYHAQATKVKCIGTQYEGTNYKVFIMGDFTDSKSMYKMLDQCAKEKYQIGTSLGLWYAWK